MSSLRPLITILLLAAVGVVLYMKINETEPVIPAGASDWAAGPLEIDMGTGGGGPTMSTPSSAAIAGDAAPPFIAGAATPHTNKPLAGDEAPAWPAARPTTADASKNVNPATSADSSPVARTAEPKVELPAVPAIKDLKADEAAAASPVAEAPAPFSTPAAAGDIKAQATKPTESKPTDTAQADPKTPTGSTPQAPTTPGSASATGSIFASVRVAVQGALDRGELSQALLLLTDWYGDPSLTPAESKEVDDLLAQLAGSVIYEGPPSHRLEPAYIVQAGETLEEVADKYEVPWQLLAKINGVSDPGALQPGQELKVIRGPFSALVDLSERKMTLFVDRRYAGKFSIELDPTSSIEEGQWKVDQKLLTPASGALYGQAAAASEDRSLLLANPADPSSQATVLRGPGSADPASAQPPGRVIKLKSADVNDVYDILSVGSRVTVRR